MSGVVIDASALMSLVTPDSRGAAVERELLGHDLAAPDLLHAEMLQAIRSLEIGQRISAEVALDAVHDVFLFPIELLPVRELADGIWRHRHNLTAYDASYVALAEGLGVPLVTLDRRIARASSIRCDVVVPD